jgi:outer membrane protein TolC
MTLKVSLLFWFILLSCTSALAISEQEVVSSSLNHAPMVIEALQYTIEKENAVTESEGAFDAKIKSKMNLRTEGYYNGDLYKVAVEKPLPFANSKIYLGQRQSFSDFPLYEGKLETQSEGESFAGLSISLLRDFAIDINRYELRQSQQDLLQAKIATEQTKIMVQTMALKSYWTWVVKGNEYFVFKAILDLANSRAGQISKRIKAGDLARIYGTENDQYIKKWEAEVIRSRMEFQKAAFYLSLFYRDQNGAPKNPLEKSVPKLVFSKLKRSPNINAIYEAAILRSPKLQILNSQKQQAVLDVAIGKNSILPKIDLSFEMSQDHGMGDETTLGQYESRVKLNFEIPLQIRKGAGKMRAGKAKAAQIKTKQRWAQEKIQVETKSLSVKLNSYADLYQVTSEQVELSKKLASAERKKFFSGASDLILVNIRDENLAQAQIKNLSSRLKYHFVDADIKKLLVEFIVK